MDEQFIAWSTVKPWPHTHLAGTAVLYYEYQHFWLCGPFVTLSYINGTVI